MKPLGSTACDFHVPPRCKSCRAIRWREYKALKGDEIRAKQREYVRNNKEKRRENQLKWYASNPGYRKKYYQENRERELERSREWALSNPDRKKEYERKWLKAHPEKIAVKNHLYRARRLGMVGCFTEDEWRAIIVKQKSRCAHCKKRCRLTVDHIVPVVRGGSNLAFNIQGLCRSCNARKGDRLDGIEQYSLFDQAV